MMKAKFFLMIGWVMMLCACQPQKELTLSGLDKKNFQMEVDGKPTDLVVITNANGLEACVTNYGARLVSLMVPDKNGVMEDVVTGFPTIAEYVNQNQNFGATVGRYIGRILGPSFTIDSVEYKLQGYGKATHISHGGKPGFAGRVWTIEQVEKDAVTLSYLSPDGENGFPGNLQVYLTYRLTADNALDLTYTATTDRPTVLNPSHHSFFNISGDFNKTVEDQLMWIDAEMITAYDAKKCVTGEYMEVSSTPFDFRAPTPVGAHIDDENDQLKVTRGYDHGWVLNTQGDDSCVAAWIYDEESGRKMEIYTTEPSVHVYSGNGLKGNLVGKDSVAYASRTSICFETMHYQNSPNIAHFPSTVLRPGETFKSRTAYRFVIE